VIVRLLLSVLLLGLALPVSAQLYKWVDADGRVHYTDQPPPADAKQDQKLNIRKTQPGAVAPTDAQTPAAPQSTAEKDLEFRKRKIDQEQAQAKAAEAENESRERCASAQRRLYTYLDAGRIYSIDDNGERVYLDDDARQRDIEAARKDVARHCK
jgi:uncharacterized protein DUF4124